MFVLRENQRNTRRCFISDLEILKRKKRRTVGKIEKTKSVQNTRTMFLRRRINTTVYEFRGPTTTTDSMLLLRDSAVYCNSVGFLTPSDKAHENTLTAHRRGRGGFYRPPRPAVFENEKNHNEHLHRHAVPVVKIPHAFTPASARGHRTSSTSNVGNNSVDNNTEHARDAHFLPRRETARTVTGGERLRTRTAYTPVVHRHTGYTAVINGHAVLPAYSYSNLNSARERSCVLCM